MQEELDLTKLKSGDRAEFEALVRLCESRVYHLALRYTNNESDAMDISQEVFLRVFRSLPDFKGDSAITTWVYRITVNTAIDLTRKKTRRKESSLTGFGEEEEDADWEIADPAPTPEAAYEQKELRGILADAIAQLSEEHRKIVVMRDVEGMSYEEIGSILSLGEGTVKSRLFRARDRLRNILEKSGNLSRFSSSKNRKGGNG